MKKYYIIAQSDDVFDQITILFTVIFFQSFNFFYEILPLYVHLVATLWLQNPNVSENKNY